MPPGVAFEERVERAMAMRRELRIYSMDVSFKTLQQFTSHRAAMDILSISLLPDLEEQIRATHQLIHHVDNFFHVVNGSGLVSDEHLSFFSPDVGSFLHQPVDVFHNLVTNLSISISLNNNITTFIPNPALGQRPVLVRALWGFYANI